MHSWLSKPIVGNSDQSYRSLSSNKESPVSYGHFLNSDSSKAHDSYQANRQDTEGEEFFNPNHYFTPGWKADALFSKPANNIKKLQEDLWNDAKLKVRGSHCFNQKVKLHIHREFTNSKIFDYQKTACLGDFTTFWHEFSNTRSEYRHILDQFIDLYSFKIATVYVFKLRFLISLARELDFKFTPNQIINPSSFLIKFFKKGSSSEVNCEALGSNQYSWYRPSAELAVTLERKSMGFEHLSISQLMRLFSYKGSQQERESNEAQEEGFSHALSHKDFGTFVNQLLIFLPLWVNNEHFKYPQREITKRNIDVINTKFTGDGLEAMVHSHWLAQENNLHIKWSELLCADFTSPHVSETTYIQVCQELHFMTFLVKFAREQKYPIKETLVAVMKEKYAKSQSSQSKQHSLFDDQKMVNDLAYDRIVLNLTKLPKKNPHHYLISQIQAQESSLSNDANILILTNQKLFVPSQSQKVELLLEKFKVKGVFDLEKLTGKGEIPHYIYILKKRTARDVRCYPEGVSVSHASQEPCLTFKATGVLEHFSMFQSISKELFSFFNTKSISTTSIYHKNINDFISLQYHQDSIIQGKLLSSQNENDHITHPNFFKNLAKNCSPLQHFYQIEDLSHYDQKNEARNFLGQSSTQDDPFQSVFIVHVKESGLASVEIAPWSTYHAKREQYGNVYYHYFGGVPKKQGINTNLLREYLNGLLGSQIVQLSLNGYHTKIKGRLQSLLIPSFLANETGHYDRFFKELSLMMASKEQILVMSPDDYLSRLESDLARLDMVKGKPWPYLSSLVHFKHVLQSTIADSQNQKSTSNYHFSNPYTLAPIAKLKTYPLHPNDEIFLDFNIENKQQLKLAYSNSTITLNNDESQKDKSSALKLYSDSHLLLTLYAEPHLLQFINFILDRAIGMEIGDVIKNIEVPSSSELKSIIDQHHKLVEMYQNTLDDVEKLISHSFKAQITS
jgi:hypothetical protein